MGWARSAAFATIAFVIVAAPGCSGCSIANDKSTYFGTTERKGKDPHTFYVNLGGEPEYIDPGMIHDTLSEALANNLFEGLTAYGLDAEPTPAVATSWDQSADNRLFRFHLRDDAKWSDGKPVTAHDFEYAWKRVLTPTTGAQSASNLYVLLNGEDFNRGRLKTLTSEMPLLERPEAAAKQVKTLPKGTALRVIARSPRKVSVAGAPFESLPAAKAIAFDPSSPKGDAPERVTIDGALREAHGESWAGKDVAVVERLAAVRCNDEDDFFYRVELDGKSAVLPGCMLGDSDAKNGYALVAALEKLPTFHAPAAAERTKAPAPASPEPPPEPLGFVALSSLADDPSVLGVRATDDRTLEVELRGPTPYFIDLTCHSTLFPVRRDVIEKFEALKEPDLWTRPENIVSNGPYVLDEWKFRYEITMKRNPHHYLFDKLWMHEIVWVEIEDYLQTMNLYQAGDIDYIGENLSLPPDYIKYLSTKADFQKKDFLASYWYEFNTKRAPTDNVLVRRALNLAIDKRQLIDKVILGGQEAATHYVPDLTGLGYADAVAAERKAGTDPFVSPDYVFNPEKARALLAEAGYKIAKQGDGFRADGFPPLEILYNTAEAHKKIAVAIQDMWKTNLGISVTLRNEEWKVMLKNVRDRNFQVVRFGWVADYNHPQTYLDTFLGFSPNNRTGWSSQKFDSLLAEAAANPDPAESMGIYRTAEKLVVDEMPKLPIYFYKKMTLMKPYIKGFHFNVRNEQLVKYYWVDPDFEQHQGQNEPAYPVETFGKPGAY